MEQHKQKCYVATLSFMSKTANKGGNIIVPVGGYFVFREDNSVFIEHAKLYVQTNPLLNIKMIILEAVLTAS